MAQLGLAAGGAVIGSFVPGIGTALGWTIGSVVGAFLFPPKGQDVEGPRLTDLKVMASTYGTPIPYGVGVAPMSGNLMWVRPGGIEEISHSEDIGGKGGASATSTTYSYYGTFAVGVCEGEVDAILQIKADGKLIYDQTAGLSTSKPGVNFRFYPGNETQLPDSIIESHEGEGEVPAHRGLCYVVFDRLPLADFGNRIPNLTFLVAFASSDPKISEDANTTSNITSVKSNSIYVDWVHERVYQIASLDGSSDSGIMVWDLSTLNEIRYKLAEDILGKATTTSDNFEIYGLSKSGDLMVSRAGTDAGADDRTHYLIEWEGLTKKWEFGGTSQTQFGQSEMGIPYNSGGSTSVEAWSLLTGYRYYQVTRMSTAVIQIMDEDGNYVWDSTNEAGVTLVATPWCVEGKSADGYGEFHFSELDTGNGDVIFHRGRVNYNAEYSSVSGNTVGVTITEAYATVDVNTLFGITAIEHLMWYDRLDDSVIVNVWESAGDANLIKINRDGTTEWTLSLDFNIDGAIAGGGWSNTRLENGRLGLLWEFGGRAIEIDIETGEVVYDETGYDVDNAASDAQLYDSRTNTVITRADDTNEPIRTYINRRTGADATVGDAARLLATKVGLTAADLETTDIDLLTLPGWVIGRPGSARAALEPLMMVYLFDAVESDYLLKFPTRGAAVVANIPEQDLADLQGGGDFYAPTRAQEVELPERVDIVYIEDTNYEQQTHGHKRLLNPVTRRSMYSRNQVKVPIPAVLDPTFVKQQAQKLLFEAWTGRVSDPMNLSWEYLELDPGDAVTVTLDDGTTFRTRLAEVGVGADLSVEVLGTREDSSQYNSTLSADNGSGQLAQSLPGPNLTKLILLPCPLLRDQDDVGRSSSQMYYAMAGFGAPGWQSASLFKSADNALFAQVGGSNNEAAWGIAQTALAAPVSPFSTDLDNTLRVYMNTRGSALSSVTKLQMLNGANAAALIDSTGNVEIIQFQNVTALGGNLYELDTLLRGRRGSEKYTGGHAEGDTFVLLEEAAGEITAMSLAEVNATRFWKGVGRGQLVEEVSAITLASPGNDLRPYAPVHLDITSGSWSSDITLEWVRRTRVGGALLDGSGVVPVSEDSEEYKLEILDGPGGSVVRTETGITSPSFVYTTAMQSADFGGSPGTLHFRVYQVSAQVGDGFVSEEGAVLV